VITLFLILAFPLFSFVLFETLLLTYRFRLFIKLAIGKGDGKSGRQNFFRVFMWASPPLKFSEKKSPRLEEIFYPVFIFLTSRNV